MERYILTDFKFACHCKRIHKCVWWRCERLNNWLPNICDPRQTFDDNWGKQPQIHLKNVSTTPIFGVYKSSSFFSTVYVSYVQFISLILQYIPTIWGKKNGLCCGIARKRRFFFSLSISPQFYRINDHQCRICEMGPQKKQRNIQSFPSFHFTSNVLKIEKRSLLDETNCESRKIR